MARNRTAAVANQVAYDLGYQGVHISEPLLSSYVQEGDEVEWRKRSAVLTSRVTGTNLHHWTLIIVGLGVFAAAIVVDYAIVSEYWTRLLSNEFGEVEPSMVATVCAKSLQVLFATLAMHFIFSAYGGVLRGLVSLLLFSVTFLMLLAIGIVWANASMPEGTKVFTGETSSTARAIEQFSQSMGVVPKGQQSDANSVAAPIPWLRENEIGIRLVSLAIVFVIVASIGAMALDTAIRGFSCWTGGSVCDKGTEAVSGTRLTSEYASFAAEDGVMRKCWRFRKQNSSATRVARSREDLISEFVKSYTAGVMDRQLAPNLLDRLADGVKSAHPDALLTSLATSVKASGHIGADAGDRPSTSDKVRPLFPERAQESNA